MGQFLYYMYSTILYTGCSQVLYGSTRVLTTGHLSIKKILHPRAFPDFYYYYNYYYCYRFTALGWPQHFNCFNSSQSCPIGCKLVVNIGCDSMEACSSWRSLKPPSSQLISGHLCLRSLRGVLSLSPQHHAPLCPPLVKEPPRSSIGSPPQCLSSGLPPPRGLQCPPGRPPQ